MGPGVNAILLACCILVGSHALRISEEEYASPDKQVLSDQQHDLLERGCEVDADEFEGGEETPMGTALSLVDVGGSHDLVDDPDSPTNEYWEASNALQRCSRTHWRRITKIILGIPVIAVGTEFLWTLVYTSPTVWAAWGQAIESVGGVVFRIIGNIWSGITTVAQYALTIPLWSFKAVFGVLFGLMYTAVAIPGMIVIIPIAATALVPIFLGIKGAEALTSLVVDRLENFFGFGSDPPICCCLEDPSTVDSNETETCVLAMPATSGDGEPTCIQGWSHEADKCGTSTTYSFDQEQTVEGCVCADFNDCMTNEYHEGHAWCEVTGPRNCGKRYAFRLKKRWDHCLYGGNPMEFLKEGNETDRNATDALASFIPNRFLERGTRSAWALGTHVDEAQGTVVARSIRAAWGSQCFTAVAMETLSGCAKLCLEERAPTARTMAGQDVPSFECAGFAYNREEHLCVRLPDFALNANFPFYSSETGEGWQHFLNKFTTDVEHGNWDREISAACPKDTIQDILEKGFTIVRDKNNGHLYVECLMEERAQKVSCIREECVRTHGDWCFVDNHCRSGVWQAFGGCAEVSEAESLTCEGAVGAIPTGGNVTDYYDVANTLNRCKVVSGFKLIKAIIAIPTVWIIGDLFWATFVETWGALITDNFMTPFFDAIFENFGPAAWSFAMSIQQMVPTVILKFFFSLAVYGLAAVYLVGGWVVGVAGTVGSFLALPILTMGIATRVTSSTVDMVGHLLGFGGRTPHCCCAEVDNNGTKTTECGLIANPSDPSAICPDGHEHRANLCHVHEVVVHSDVQTVQGCYCADYSDCRNNYPHNGHAWCSVDGPTNNCGYFSLLSRSNWDYCMFSGGNNLTEQVFPSNNQSVLSMFIPNRLKRLDVFGPGNVLTLGTYTDAKRAVTTARPGGDQDKRECFVGLPFETLGACAQACYDEGAPSELWRHRCAAFAWNPQEKLCVRLPYFAADAKYTPLLKQWDGSGWQNFVSQYFAKPAYWHGFGKVRSCPLVTLQKLDTKGFAIARNKHNGHLYLRCKGDTGPEPFLQKASCIPKECEGKEHCQVKNHCGRIFNRCKRLHSEPLSCESDATKSSLVLEPVN